MIPREDIEHLKEIFVSRNECKKNTNLIEEKITKDNVRLAVIENQLKLILWLLASIGGGTIAILLKIFFGEV